MPLMPPAVVDPVVLPKGGSVIDPTWISAASSVLGGAMRSAPAGPSRAESDTGGIFGFSAPFTVSTGSGDANGAGGSLVSTLFTVAVIVAIGALAWKLAKKS